MSNPYLESLQSTSLATGAVASPANPYLDLLQTDEQARKAQQAAQLSQAVKVNPDQYSAQRRVAQYLGYPVAATEALPGLADQAKVQKVQQDTASSPVLQRRYSDADFAKLAHDDSFTLANLETAVGKAVRYVMGAAPGGGLAGDLEASLYRSVGAVAGTKRAAVDVIEPWARLVAGDDNWFAQMSKYYAGQATSAEDMVKRLSPPTDSTFGSGVSGGVQSFGQNAKYLPLALAGPGGGVLALAGMVGESFGASYNKAADKNLPLWQSLGYASADAMVEYWTEKLPMDKLIGGIQQGAPLIKTFAKQLGYEIPGEQLATVLQDLNEWATLNPQKSFKDYLVERPDAAVQTLIATVIGTGGNVMVTSSIANVLDTIGGPQWRNNLTQSYAEMLQEQLRIAGQSALRERSPEQFRSLVQQITEGNPGAPKSVYVDGEVLNQLPAEVLTQLPAAVQAQIPEAAATGNVVEIPMADVLTVAPGTELEQVLNQHARMDPFAQSQAEAEASSQQAQAFLQQEAQRVIEQAADQEALRQSQELVKTNIKEQLAATGRFRDAVNEGYATWAAAFYTAYGSRLGMTPEQFYQRYPLRVLGAPVGQQTGVLNAGERSVVNNMTAAQIQAEITDLMPRVQQAYEAGNAPLAERLDARLEALMDALDANLAELEEDTLTPADLLNPVLAAKIQEGEQGDAEADVVRDLANRWRDMQARQGDSQAEQAAEIKAVLDDYAFRHGGLREGLSDTEVLDAARDAYDAVYGRLERQRERMRAQAGGVFNQAAVERLQMVAERGVRATASRSIISAEERTAIQASAPAINMSVAELETIVRNHKLAHPVAQGWEPLVYVRSVLKDGKALHQYQNSPYTFSAGTDGKQLEPGTANYTRRVNAVARSMVDEVRTVFRRAANGDRNAQNILAQAGWYKAMRSRLRREFGGLGDLFADLLGATSPNTPVRDNWFNAVDALRRASRGDFDPLILQWESWADNLDTLETDLRAWFNERMAEGLSKKAIKELPEYQAKLAAVRAAREIPDSLLPTKESGSKYGFNGKNVIRAMVDLWRIVKNADPDIARGGTAPKALNFSGNLIGFRSRATIDVWAARMLQRLAGGRRIASMAETGVSGDMREDATTTLQFGFGQDVFGNAALAIRNDPELQTDAVLAEINDDDLQAVVWFVEKEIWTVNDWTSAAGEGGSFELEANLTGTSQQERVKELRTIIDASPPTADVTTASQDTTAALKAIEDHERQYAAEIEELRKLTTGEIAPYKGSKKRMDELGKLVRPPAEATRLLGSVDRAKARLEAFNVRKVAAKAELAALEREVDRFVGGLSIQMSKETQGIDFVPTDADMARLAEEIRRSVYEADKGNTVLASKALSTEGRYGGVERSLDLEVVAREGYNANTLWLEMLRQAQAAQQDSTFLSRVLRANEEVDPLRHRPGVEIYFQSAAAQAQLEKMLAELAKEGVEFLTVIVDGRRLGNTMAGQMPAAVGVRLQYVPEFEQRYGMDDFRGLDDVAIADKINERAAELDRLAARVSASVEGVSFAGQFWYDTQVAFSHEYQEKIDALTTRTAESEVAQAGGGVWAGQPIRAGLESADRQSRETAGGEPGGDVLGGNAQRAGVLKQQPLAQGPRGTFNPQTLELVLNPNADLSTWFHETGHFFLEVLADVASQPDAPAQIVEDYNKVLAWFGVTPEQWAGYSLDEKRPYHERWAESIEQYVMEGKAPSVELQGVMRRFRAWLTSVYGSIKQFLAQRGVAQPGGETLGQETPRRSTQEVARIFSRMVKEAEQDLTSALFNWNDSRLNEDKDKIVLYPGRDARFVRGKEGGKSNVSKAEFLNWLMSDAPFDPAVYGESIKADAEWRGQIEKLRGIVSPQSLAQGDQPTGPNIQLNDDIRRVMDRMLATGEQIAQANEVAGFMPDEQADGEAAERLQKRSIADLKWSVKARDKVIAKLKKQAREVEKATREQVTAEVNAMPEVQANDMLAKTRKENGRELNDVERAVIADAFGYESVDAMLKAIDAFGSKKDAIDGLTEQRMLEENGDLIDERAIQEAANEAVHNEARARSLATELRTQREMLGQRTDTGEVNARGAKITVNALVEAAKQFGANVIARTPLKDLKATAWKHTAAERRAGKRWAEATAKGETQEAVQAKQDQVLNNAAAKAAIDAATEAKKILEFFKRVTKGNDEKTVEKGRDPDIVNAARAVLAAYGIETPTTKGAAAYLETVKANDPDTYSAIEPMIAAATQNAQPLEALTFEELQGLAESIRAMWFLAKRSRQMEVAGDLLDIDDVAQDLYTRLEEIGIPDRVAGEGMAVTQGEERTLFLQQGLAFLRRVEQWAEGMDGKYGGPFLRFIFQPIKDAADRYRKDRIDYRKKFQALVDNLAPIVGDSVIQAPELGYTFGTPGSTAGTAMNEILHAIAHTGNDSNKRKLLLGRGWATENPDGTLDTSRWDAFIRRLVNEGKLERAHFDFVQGVWDLLEQTKPLAQKAHRDAFGRYFSEVTANAFVDPFGVTRRGGYVPAQVDSRQVKDNALRKLAEEENNSMAYAFPQPAMGFTKSRTEYNKPLMLDLRTLSQHLDKVLLFSHMTNPARDVRKLLMRPKVNQPLNRVQPAAIESMLQPWLQRSAQQIVEDPIVGSGKWARIPGIVRSRAGMALMFANVSNAIQQITGLAGAAVRVKPSYLMRSLAQYVASPVKFSRAVWDASPYMDDRAKNEVAVMNEQMQAILIKPSTFQKAQDFSMRHAYFLQTALDNVLSPIVWTGALNQALADGMSEQDAIRFADSTVRQTQGSTLPEDVSRFETGPAYARAFTQFVSYFNMMANTNGTALKQIAGEVGLKKGAGKALYVVMMGLMAPIWVAEAIALAFKGGPEDEDDDGYLDDWLAAVFGMGTTKGLLAQIPILGQFGVAAANRFNDNPLDDRVSLSPAISLLESSVSAPESVYKAIVEDGSAQKAIRDVATLVSVATGVPVYGLARPIGYAAGVAQGKIEPTGPADVARGLVTGTASPESKVR